MAGIELVLAILIGSLMAALAVIVWILARAVCDLAKNKPFHVIETERDSRGVLLVRRLQGENESLRARLAERQVVVEDESEVHKDDEPRAAAPMDEAINLERI